MLSSLSHFKSLALLLLAMSPVTLAQQQQQQAIHSPEVGSDGRVTLRLRAPNAQKVEVHLEGTKQALDLVKSEGAVWSVTTQSLPPDYYG
ncbi:MAG: hypothetical protein JO185_10740, partial [Acidobacteriaceae bacterium]|nr:hypothetical protein [Acidobacteriaceae bacterium]